MVSVRILVTGRFFRKLFVVENYISMIGFH